MATHFFYASAASWKGYMKELVPSVGSQVAVALGNVIPMVLVAQSGNNRSIAVFGLANFFIALVVSPWANTVAEVAGIHFAVNVGAKRYDLVIDYFYKSILIEVAVFGLMVLLSYYADTILIFIDVLPELAVPAGRLIWASNLYLPFMHLNRLIGSFMGAQKTNGHFYLLSVLSIGLTFLLGAYFVRDLGMNEMGMIPTKIIIESLLFVLNIFFMIRESRPDVLGPPNFATLFVDMWTYFKRITLAAFSVFMDYITFEYNTWLAALMHSVDALALWQSFTSIGVSFFYAAFGISSVMRAHVGHLVGEGDMETARRECIAYYFYSFVVCQSTATLLLVFAWPVAGLYMSDPLLQLNLTSGIYIVVVFIYPCMVFYPTFSVLRILGLDVYFFKMIVFFYPILVFLINTSLVYLFGLGVTGLYIGSQLVVTIMVAIFIHKVFWLHDWLRDTVRPLSQVEKEESLMMEERRRSFVRITIECGGSIDDSDIPLDTLERQSSKSAGHRPAAASNSKTLKPSAFSKLN